MVTALALSGAPWQNLTSYILDSADSPVPIGVSGELYIGGAGLARGYLNGSDLTAERFIANPFLGRGSASMVQGDVCRYPPNGEIEYLGRIDHQVKVRGFRIELGEMRRN